MGAESSNPDGTSSTTSSASTVKPTNDPAVIDYYDASTGYSTYNGSIYTGYSDIMQIVENYPYIVWEPNSLLGEAYELRLILEIILWGGFGCLLEVLVNMGGLANIANPDYPNAPGNDIGIFTEDIVWYKVVGFMKLV